MKTITKVLGMDKTENRVIFVVLLVTTAIAVVCKLTGISD